MFAYKLITIFIINLTFANFIYSAPTEPKFLTVFQTDLKQCSPYLDNFLDLPKYGEALCNFNIPATIPPFRSSDAAVWEMALCMGMYNAFSQLCDIKNGANGQSQIDMSYFNRSADVVLEDMMKEVEPSALCKNFEQVVGHPSSRGPLSMKSAQWVDNTLSYFKKDPLRCKYTCIDIDDKMGSPCVLIYAINKKIREGMVQRSEASKQNPAATAQRIIQTEPVHQPIAIKSQEAKPEVPAKTEEIVESSNGIKSQDVIQSPALIVSQNAVKPQDATSKPLSKVDVEPSAQNKVTESEKQKKIDLSADEDTVIDNDEQDQRFDKETQKTTVVKSTVTTTVRLNQQYPVDIKKIPGTAKTLAVEISQGKVGEPVVEIVTEKHEEVVETKPEVQVPDSPVNPQLNEENVEDPKQDLNAEMAGDNFEDDDDMMSQADDKPIQKDLDENAQLAKIDKTKVDDERYLQHEVSDPQFNYEDNEKRPANLYISKAGLVQDVDSEVSLMPWYLMVIFCVFFVYISFTNKKKVCGNIVAYVVEGRPGSRHGRRSCNGGGSRPNTANYRKLDSNLEEAITSANCNTTASHVIY